MYFGLILLVISDMFLDYAITARPHASAANSDWIEARGPGKSTKMLVKNIYKYDVKTKKEKGWILGRFWVDFVRPLGLFWQSTCVKKCNENLEAFLEVEKVVKKVRPQSVKTGCGRGVLLTGGGQGPRLRSKYTYIRTHIHRTNTHSNVTRMTERAT